MRHALITGASTGIGRASAIALKDKGFEVWAGVRSDTAADNVEADGLHPLLLDVTNPTQVANAAGLVLAKSGGKLDVLVNNAGVAVTDPIEVLSDEDLARQFEVNVFGLHRVTRTLLPAVIAAKGRIINMGSIAGRVGLPLMAPYVASKHALEGYTDSLRREVKHLGVSVHIIEPGQVDTPIWNKAVPADDYLEKIPAHYRQLGVQAIERASKDGSERVDVSEVAAVVVHAASSRFAKARYALPLREKILSRVSAAVPEFVMDRLIQSSMRKG